MSGGSHQAIAVALLPTLDVMAIPPHGPGLALERAVLALQVLPEQLASVLQLLGRRGLLDAGVCERHAAAESAAGDAAARAGRQSFAHSRVQSGAA
jgi:hypothetical protein